MDSRSLIRFPSSCRAGTTFRLNSTAHSLTASSMPAETCIVGGEADQIGVAEMRGALAWWLDSGVDTLVQEEPRDCLKPAEPKLRAKAAETPPPNIVEPSHETLAELRDWLSSSMQ